MTKKRNLVAAYLALAAVVGGAVWLLSYITLYSDDYQYAAFFRGGFSSFLEKTREHYLFNNGRALVHFLAEVFLLFGTKLYALLFPLLLAAAFILASRLTEGTKKCFSPWVPAVAMAVLLALPAEYLRETLCWVSGSFNYCFPFLPVMLYFTFLLRGTPKQILPAFLLGFLAGATTEQSGLAALVGGCLFALLKTVREREEKRVTAVRWASVLFVLLGYLTVLLAPGTASRMALSGGNGLSVLLHPRVLLGRLETIMYYFAGGGAFQVSARPLILALLGLLGCLPLVFRRLRLRPLLAAFPAAVLYQTFLLLHFDLLAHLALLSGLLLCGVCLLTDEEFSADGVLLLSGLASFGVMVFTELGAYRTVVPMLLLLITVLARLFFAVLEAYPKKISALGGCAVLLLCAFLAFPTFRGYRANAAVIAENEESIRLGRETGTIVLKTDFDNRYRHLLMFDGSYFFTQFRVLYDLPAGTAVYLEGEHYAHYPVFLSGEELASHAVMTGGVLYLPLVDLFRHLGGDCVWDFEGQNGYYLSYGGELYYLSRADGTVRRRETGEIVLTDVTTAGILDKDYIDALSAESFFGFSREFDGAALWLQFAQ